MKENEDVGAGAGSTASPGFQEDLFPFSLTPGSLPPPAQPIQMFEESASQEDVNNWSGQKSAEDLEEEEEEEGRPETVYALGKFIK